MKTLTFTTFLLLVSCVFGHGIYHQDVKPQTWKLKNGNDSFEAFYLLNLDDTVLFELPTGAIYKVRKMNLDSKSLNEIIKKENRIKSINQPVQLSNAKLWLVYMLRFSILLVAILIIVNSKWMMFNVLRRISAVVGLFILFSLISAFNNSKMGIFSNQSDFLDSSFQYFKSNINTGQNDSWYLVESNGLPHHETMLGITAWQQQVPLPQCYTGTNSWKIPLYPTVAANPIPVNTQHFLRGAIALAVNGIPIFSPYTNTGVDAYLDGQLDIYGGHSGRADDYHYHVAPTILYEKIPLNKPLAIALDGFAIYGNIEPTGIGQLPLDSNHGHFWTDGSYHYHISKSAPYMIKNMVGKVVEDNTMQIIPQAAAKGVRPALTPLKGAKILSNKPHADGLGFTLIYELNSQLDSIVYSWDQNGNYTYRFYSATNSTTQTYKGMSPCFLNKLGILSELDTDIKILNTPEGLIKIESNPFIVSKCNSLKLFNIKGQIVFESKGWIDHIDAHLFNSGIYFVEVNFDNRRIVTKCFLSAN